jgi:hypothetical protein
MTPSTVDISTGFVTLAFSPHELHDDGSPTAHYQVGKSNINEALSETTFSMSSPYMSICNSCCSLINLRRV